MRNAFDVFCRACASWAGSPMAFLWAFLTVIIWAVTGPHFGWSDSHSLFINTCTTIVTFLMVFVLQNSQNRDTDLLQAKIDTMLRMQGQMMSKMMELEETTEDEMDDLQKQYKQLIAEVQRLTRPVRKIA
jgi:low affinity Fe/Cu permease